MFFLAFVVTLQLFSELAEKVVVIARMTMLFTITAIVIQDGAEEKPSTNKRRGQKLHASGQISLA